MIRVLIIEDEKPAYENLLRFLAKIDSEMEVINWLQSVEDSIQWFDKNELPDLIFMDIQLSDGNSFEILKNKPIDCPIIFTTAYDQYALEAFEHYSIDYLLKPISKLKLQKGIDKFYRSRNEPNNQLSDIKLLMENLKGSQKYKERFLVKSGEQLLSIPSQEIASFYVDEICILQTLNGERYSINSSLDALVEQLNPKEFFRLNRKAIASFQSIEKIVRFSDSKLKVALKPAAPFDLIVSKEKVSKFKAWLEGL